jgi:hypothetical protein
LNVVHTSGYVLDFGGVNVVRRGGHRFGATVA